MIVSDKRLKDLFKSCNTLDELNEKLLDLAIKVTEDVRYDIVFTKQVPVQEAKNTLFKRIVNIMN